MRDSNMSNISKLEDDDVSLDDLYLALIQCFAVIICGYVAGRTKMITQRETSGLNTFVGKFSLPSLMLISLCKIKLSSVNWMFILAVFTAKTIMFFLVLLVTLVVSRPTNIARAGLLAILCTQTNDIAIGVPVVNALYGKTHPDFTSYLYLLAPISLTILNPIGFALMEIGKQTPSNVNNEPNNVSRLQLARNVAQNVITNPMVFMTLLGVLGNIIFSQSPPAVLDSVLSVFASAFTSTSLMLLGLRMVNRLHKLQGIALLAPSLLIITKLLITPLVMREVVGLFLSLQDIGAAEFRNFTTFSFMYGILPSAAAIYVYATQYAVDVDLVSTAMVVGTFLSAPLMFISARMISASSLDPERYEKTLSSYEFHLNIVSFICGIIVLLVFTLKKKFKFPHKFTMLLIITQLIGCGASFYKYIDSTNDFRQIPSTIVDMCCALWVASLAIALLFIFAHAECTLRKVQLVFILLPWIIPLIMLFILMMLYESDYPHHYFTLISDGLYTSILLFALIVTVVSLTLGERNRRRETRYLLLTQEIFADAPSVIDANGKSEGSRNVAQVGSDNSIEQSYVSSPPQPYFDQLNSHSNACEEDMQLLRHFIFLIVLSCSLAVSLALTLWKLVFETETGLYVELSFLEISLKRGQCLICFCVFMLDNKNVIKPLAKRILKLWYGGEPVKLPHFESLPFETRLICDQFTSDHLVQCKLELEKAKWRSFLYGKCFSGSSLVNWLMHHGLASNADEASGYASKLLAGRVIRHIYNTEYFYNTNSLYYTFIVSH